MRLISQDGAFDVPYEQASVMLVEGKKIFARVDGYLFRMANYETSEDAEKELAALKGYYLASGDKDYFMFSPLGRV